MRKQKVNEPALVMHTARAVADARQVSIEEIDRMTTLNAQRFFGWE
jgi:Tat protein secretion system quality control protein TatD with DNase activity